MRGVLLYLWAMLPIWFYVSVAAIFGLIIGSFLNVVIYRLHTGKSLNDRSHCLSCGTTLRWYELVPVFSYIFLRGRCSNCHSFIPWRYTLVELLTSTLFVLAYLKFVDLPMLIILCLFLSVLVVGAVYDLYHMIIPDEVSFATTVLAFVLLFYQSWHGSGWGLLWEGLLGSVVAFLFFFGLWFMSHGKWLGFGDAKLAVGLGALVGLGGVFSLLVFSFWIGAVLSLLFITLERITLHINRRFKSRPRVRMKSEIPFAPFLILAFLLVYFTDWRVLDIFTELVSRFV